MENVKNEEVVVVGGDLIGHGGRSMDGFEGVHGGYGYGVRNVEGERILEFADGADLLICNTQFQKDDNSSLHTRQVGRRQPLTTCWCVGEIGGT